MGRKPVYDWKRGRELYDAGCNDYEIGRKLGCAAQTVFDWRKRNGIATNQAVDRGLKGAVLRLMRQGMSNREISNRLGCHASYPSVVRWSIKDPGHARKVKARARDACHDRHTALIGMS